MVATDKQAFCDLLNGVHSFYGKEVSKFALSVWWNSMKQFDLAAVNDALGRHCMNPDSGQWCPRPADVVRMLGGSTLDSAMQAWAKLERAVMQVGPHQSVVFDDPLIHRVVEEMGGWIGFGKILEKEWPFTQKEFENRYRFFRARSEVPAYKTHLIGLNEAHNAQHGFKPEPPVLIGDAARAQLVYEGGHDRPALQVTSISALSKAALPQLPAAA